MYVRSVITPFVTSRKVAPQIDRNRMRLAWRSNTGEETGAYLAMKQFVKNTLTNGRKEQDLD